MWVDADACPGAVKEIILRAAVRLCVRTVFVANKPLKLPISPYVSSERVGAGLDVADGRIAQNAQPGDLAVTADIPLAARLVEKGVTTLDPRGTLYDAQSMGEVLALRNFMHELREGGVQTSGPKGFGPRDAQQFAATFDRELSRALKAARPSTPSPPRNPPA
ncbi:MAG: YaiI/YqxD family protein [Deltaproteobacteria bacterium]|nr:YaiI/YqxD family protein [Deltaproteobacteria bacterium]